jgi:uncharacterized protein YjeT (DUF2065 family)
MASFIRIAAATARMLGEQVRRAGEVQPAAPSLPPSRSDRVVALAGYWGFNAALLLSAALALGFLTIGSNAVWLGWLKVVLGVTLVVEGLLLLSDWRGARRLVLQRIQQRRGARGGERPSFSRLILRQLTSLALQLLGLVWLGAGTLVAARGVEQIL